MDSTIEQLQKTLQEKIERLDRERAEQTAAFNREMEERRTIEAAEREERVRQIKDAEARVVAKKIEAEKAEALRQKEATEARLRAELRENEAQELVNKQKERLEWIENEINKVEFAEEQHRKTQETKTVSVVSPMTNEELDNAHILTGEAALGTDGIEVGPDLSSHLKSILRRANSEVNI